MKAKLLILAIVIAAIALTVIVGLQRMPVDGIRGAVYSMVFGHDTFWQKGFTDEAFQEVRVGMSRAQVYKLLGPPQSLALTPDDNGEMPAGWTASGQLGSNFRRRQVIFRNDEVVAKVADFCFR